VDFDVGGELVERHGPSHTIVGMTPEEMADFVHRPAITRPNTMKRSEAYENNDM
jgi:hypothetical protein